MEIKMLTRNNTIPSSVWGSFKDIDEFAEDFIL